MPVLLSARGILYTWGKSEAGQAGQGETTPLLHPTMVRELRTASQRVASVACGARHMIAWGFVVEEEEEAAAEGEGERPGAAAGRAGSPLRRADSSLAPPLGSPQSSVRSVGSRGGNGAALGAAAVLDPMGGATGPAGVMQAHWQGMPAGLRAKVTKRLNGACNAHAHRASLHAALTLSAPQSCQCPTAAMVH